MKNLKLVTVGLLIILIGLTYSDKHSLDYLHSKTIESVTIESQDASFNQYFNSLLQLADSSDIILLNSRFDGDTINWYCLGTDCNLSEGEYYATANDKNAKQVIPVILYFNPMIYPFESVENFSMASNTYTLIGDSDNISSFIKAAGQQFVVIEDSSVEVYPHQNINLILICGLLVMLVITIIANGKKYLLDKYNGKYFSEVLVQILKNNIIAIFASAIIVTLLLFVNLNNTQLFLRQIPTIYIIYIVLLVLLTIVELIICLVFRRLFSYKNLSNTISKYCLVLLFLSTLIIGLVANVLVIQAGSNVRWIVDSMANVPPLEVDEYYSYFLRIAGTGASAFEYFEEYVDPNHVEFYKQTEEQYSGVVSCFTNCSFDYPIVNSNYLNYIKRDISIDDSKINLISKEPVPDIPSSFNPVYDENDQYPYIESSTGLLETYNGPIAVINSNVIDDIDPTLISSALQMNSYYLKLDDAQLSEVNQLRKELGLEQNVSDLYKISSISNRFVTEQKQALKQNLNILITSIGLTILNLLMCISYRFEINKLKLSLAYLHGETKLNILKSEIEYAIVPLVISTMIISVMYRTIVYGITFLAALTLIAGIYTYYNWRKVENNISQLMKE